MNILITGGTGFIGTELRTKFLRDGHQVTVITRSPGEYEDETARNQQFIDWEAPLTEVMDQTDVVINLAGENLFGKRWTDKVKDRLYNSRIDCTNKLVDAIGSCSKPPGVMVSASGVDYYGDCGNEVVREDHPAGDKFLAKLCADWEEAAMKAKEYGVRVVTPRLGIVLEKGGGALGKMLLPFKLFVGGPLGNGRQYFPWIHMDDLCRGIIYTLDKETLSGACNLSSPNPVTMNEFASALGEVLHRPSMFRVPELAIRLALGEASDPILDSKKVVPEKLQNEGFQFKFTNLHEALSDIV